MFAHGRHLGGTERSTAKQTVKTLEENIDWEYGEEAEEVENL